MRSSKVAGPSFKIFDAVIESNEAEKHTDLEMEKFEHLLRDYLTSTYSLNTEVKMRQAITNATATSLVNEIGPPADTSSKAAKAASADDYVYDIFYYRPSTASEFVSASAVATVTGLPPNSDDEGFSSESEDEDEADEDSNGEHVRSISHVRWLMHYKRKTFTKMTILTRSPVRKVRIAVVSSGCFVEENFNSKLMYC